MVSAAVYIKLQSSNLVKKGDSLCITAKCTFVYDVRESEVNILILFEQSLSHATRVCNNSNR